MRAPDWVEFIDADSRDSVWVQPLQVAAVGTFYDPGRPSGYRAVTFVKLNCGHDFHVTGTPDAIRLALRIAILEAEKPETQFAGALD